MIVASTLPVVDGTAPSYVTPAASETVPVGSTLIVRNGSASSVTVTLVAPGTLTTGDAYPDKVYTVAASGESWLPVLKDYRNPDTGVADVTFSATASVTVAAVNLR